MVKLSAGRKLSGWWEGVGREYIIGNKSPRWNKCISSVHLAKWNNVTELNVWWKLSYKVPYSVIGAFLAHVAPLGVKPWPLQWSGAVSLHCAVIHAPGSSWTQQSSCFLFCEQSRVPPLTFWEALLNNTPLVLSRGKCHRVERLDSWSDDAASDLISRCLQVDSKWQISLD